MCKKNCHPEDTNYFIKVDEQNQVQYTCSLISYSDCQPACRFACPSLVCLSADSPACTTTRPLSRQLACRAIYANSSRAHPPANLFNILFAVGVGSAHGVIRPSHSLAISLAHPSFRSSNRPPTRQSTLPLHTSSVCTSAVKPYVRLIVRTPLHPSIIPPAG